MLIPVSNIPKTRLGPETTRAFTKSATIGVFPLDNETIVVGKLTLVVKVPSTDVLYIGDYHKTEPLTVHDHVAIGNLLKDLGSDVYDSRFKYKWCKKVVLVNTK